MRSASRNLGLAAALTTVVTGSAVADPVELATGDNLQPFTAQDLPGSGIATAIVRAFHDHLGRPIQKAPLAADLHIGFVNRRRFSIWGAYVSTHRSFVL
jgi:hypothetical protein